MIRDVRKWLLVTTGAVFVVIGAIGAILPIVPTTPFLLVAAACFARSSDRLYERLLESQPFGPIIREYRDRHTIPARAKSIAILMIMASFSFSIIFFVDNLFGKALMASVALGMATFMYYLPSSH